MKNCSTKNFTNIMKTYLDFNKKYKILKKHVSPQMSPICIIYIYIYIYICRERERYIYILNRPVQYLKPSLSLEWNRMVTRGMNSYFLVTKPIF